MSSSYQFLHAKTGMPLHGFRIGEATPEEVSAANQRLKANGSEFRLIPYQPHARVPSDFAESQQNSMGALPKPQ